MFREDSECSKTDGSTEKSISAEPEVKLVTCARCGRHFHLCFSGEASEEFATKRQGLGIIYEALLGGKITSVQATLLEEMILQSLCPSYMNTDAWMAATRCIEGMPISREEKRIHHTSILAAWAIVEPN
ncbi:MAG: hypothetical protein WC757_03995 [Candidatus Paceibacterota bacterium]|jgi:hypothetical protein